MGSLDIADNVIRPGDTVSINLVSKCFERVSTRDPVQIVDTNKIYINIARF